MRRIAFFGLLALAALAALLVMPLGENAAPQMQASGEPKVKELPYVSVSFAAEKALSERFSRFAIGDLLCRMLDTSDFGMMPGEDTIRAYTPTVRPYYLGSGFSYKSGTISATKRDETTKYLALQLQDEAGEPLAYVSRLSLGVNWGALPDGVSLRNEYLFTSDAEGWVLIPISARESKPFTFNFKIEADNATIGSIEDFGVEFDAFGIAEGAVGVSGYAYSSNTVSIDPKLFDQLGVLLPTLKRALQPEVARLLYRPLEIALAYRYANESLYRASLSFNGFQVPLELTTIKDDTRFGLEDGLAAVVVDGIDGELIAIPLDLALGIYPWETAQTDPLSELRQYLNLPAPPRSSLRDRGLSLYEIWLAAGHSHGIAPESVGMTGEIIGDGVFFVTQSIRDLGSSRWALVDHSLKGGVYDNVIDQIEYGELPPMYSATFELPGRGTTMPLELKHSGPKGSRCVLLSFAFDAEASGEARQLSDSLSMRDTGIYLQSGDCESTIILTVESIDATGKTVDTRPLAFGVRMPYSEFSKSEIVELSSLLATDLNPGEYTFNIYDCDEADSSFSLTRVLITSFKGTIQGDGNTRILAKNVAINPVHWPEYGLRIRARNLEETFGPLVILLAGEEFEPESDEPWQRWHFDAAEDEETSVLPYFEMSNRLQVRQLLAALGALKQSEASVEVTDDSMLSVDLSMCPRREFTLQKSARKTIHEIAQLMSNVDLSEVAIVFEGRELTLRYVVGSGDLEEMTFALPAEIKHLSPYLSIRLYTGHELRIDMSVGANKEKPELSFVLGYPIYPAVEMFSNLPFGYRDFDEAFMVYDFSSADGTNIPYDRLFDVSMATKVITLKYADWRSVHSHKRTPAPWVLLEDSPEAMHKLTFTRPKQVEAEDLFSYVDVRISTNTANSTIARYSEVISRDIEGSEQISFEHNWQGEGFCQLMLNGWVCEPFAFGGANAVAPKDLKWHEVLDYSAGEDLPALFTWSTPYLSENDHLFGTNLLKIRQHGFFAESDGLHAGEAELCLINRLGMVLWSHKIHLPQDFTDLEVSDEFQAKLAKAIYTASGGE